MKLECFPTQDRPPEIVPGRAQRNWMEVFAYRHPYRCLPLTMANTTGWEILCPVSFTATWNGGMGEKDITFRAEGYRLHATDVGVTTDRYGAFLDLVARTSRRWIFGVRYDYAEAPRGLEDTEWRVTPTITWWQSEFVYLRLEGQHRDSDLEGARNLLTLQAVWAMGPHKHETY